MCEKSLSMQNDPSEIPRYVICIIYLLTIVCAEVRELVLVVYATYLCSLVLAPFASEEMLRIEQVGGGGTVAESAATSSEAIILLETGCAMITVLTTTLV